MYLIVGLGNPGPEYEKTRHNLGFMVIGELCRRLRVSQFKSKFHSFIAEEKMGEHRVVLAQPQTFMNNSGLAVRGIGEWFKIDPQKIILIYDDVDLEVGQIRIREKGGPGGHHGMESVINSLGTSSFPRVRIGIGRENLSQDVSDYVLQAIPPSQRAPLEAAVIAAAEAVECIVTEGLMVAMNRYNG